MPNLQVLKSDGSYRDVTEAEWLAVVAGGGGSGTTAAEFQGNVANDAPDAGNPVEIGGYASSAAPTSVTLADRVRAWFQLNGAQAIYNAYQIDPFNDQAGAAPFSVPIEGSHTRNASIDTAITITPTGDFIVMQATTSGKNVRYTLDGTVPTATLGFVMVAQDEPVRFPTAGKTFKVIAETAGASIEYQNEEFP